MGPLEERAMDPMTCVAFAWLAAYAATAAYASTRAAYARVLHHARHGPTNAKVCTSIVLVRPCAGIEPHLARALRSSGCARTRVPLHVRIAIGSAEDAAYGVALDAARDLRASGIDAELVVTRAEGPNHKADQIARALAQAPHVDVVVVADSDVDLDGVDLDVFVAPILRGNVVASWAAPVEVAPTSSADRVSAAVLDASLHAFPLLAALDPGGMAGKLVAIDANALARVGGFGALVGHLGEDMELARRLRAEGGRVALAPFIARSLACDRSAREVLARYTRWLLVIRAQRTWLLATYPLVLACVPLLLLLCAIAAAREGWPAAVAFALVLTTRAAVAFSARALTRCDGRVRRRGLVAGALLADLLLLVAFVRALGPARFAWRARSLRLGARGSLEAVR